ncbi:MAG: ATP-grasp domain-containing protein [Planctomycetota bacterium]
MIKDVLVIYNAADDKHLARKVAWRESNAGVLAEVKAVTAALKKLGVDYDVRSIRDIKQLPDVLSHNKQRIVFNLVEELPGNILDACYVPAICRAHGKVSTGSDTASLLLAQDKWKTKAVLEEADLPCPAGAVVPLGQKIRPEYLAQGKYIVKPVLSDASEGINADSIVELPGENLDKTIEYIHAQFKQPAIVEQFIAPRELNVSVLQINGDIKVLPIAEIDFAAFGSNRPRIVDYEAKWRVNSFTYNHTPRIIPAQLSAQAARLVCRYALKVWYAIGCQDYARVDFRMDKNEQPFILEVNPNPDISPDAGFAAALAVQGMAYEEFIEILINNASLKQG